MPPAPSAARTALLLTAGLLAASPAPALGQAGSGGSSPAIIDRGALESLGPFLDSLSVSQGVPGLSFAVFSSEGVLYEHVGGVKNLETGDPVDAATIFEAASITKPMLAWIVQDLVLTRGLDLDASLGSLVDPIPDVGHDPRAAGLTPRLLLSHRGGLPNWRARLNVSARTRDELFPGGDTLRFISEPGTEYLYSGEGYVLLQRVLEQWTGTPFSELLRQHVFEPAGMHRSFAAFAPSVMGSDAAFGHTGDGVPDKWQIQVPLASSTLHTTARDLALFGVRLAQEVQEDGPWASLTEPQVRVAERGSRRLQWGLGFGIVTDGPRTWVFQGGNNVIFIGDFIYDVENDLGYALLTNSSNGRGMVVGLEERFFGRLVRN